MKIVSNMFLHFRNPPHENVLVAIPHTFILMLQVRATARKSADNNKEDETQVRKWSLNLVSDAYSFATREC